MEYLEKRIKINENRILIYSISYGYAKPTFTISEGFREKDELVKTYDLCQWDDYGFDCWINNTQYVLCNTVVQICCQNKPLFIVIRKVSISARVENKTLFINSETIFCYGHTRPSNTGTVII